MHDEKESIAAMFKQLAQLYNRKMTSDTADRWAAAWAPYDASRLQAAMDALVPVAKFMPSISELRAAVAHLYPSDLARDIANEWLRRRGWDAPLPSQKQIDAILEEWGKPAGVVKRSYLVAK